jgi:glycosyltransferase involved in cell wall biosynthesis
VLVIVGDGDERAALERTAGELGIADAVRFVGKTDRLEEYLAASDISVLPSTYEPFGTCSSRRWRRGCRVLPWNPTTLPSATASKEIIEDGRTGLFVPGGDPEPLARALDELVGKSRTSETLGSRRRRHVGRAIAGNRAPRLMRTFS